MAYLKCTSGPEAGRKVVISQTDFQLGRDKSVNFCISDPSVSRHHAVIRIVGGEYAIEDLKSNNGILVNSKRTQCEVLKDGDTIDIGNSHFRFFLRDPDCHQPSSDLVIDPGIPFDEDRSIVLSAQQFQFLSGPSDGSGSIATKSASEKHLQQLHAMLRISNATATIVNLTQLLTELMAVIFDETKATRGFMMLYDENKVLVPMLVKKKTSSDSAITVSHTIINTVINEKKAILSSDLMNDHRFDIGESIITNRIRSCMCVPLLCHNEVLGIIHIDSDVTSSIFCQEDLNLLMALAGQAATCIRNAQLLRKITEEENKRSRLSQYFPPSQVEMLIKDRENSTLGGKKENVSIIFCDIRNFTSYAEDLEAIQVMNLLNEFFSIMTEIIFSYDGMVDNFMGDCIMAVFGGPFLHGDDPERAVKAAIDMQLAQRRLNAKFIAEGQKPFGIGIGIHTGDVCRGNIGSSQLKKYTVIGNTVNIASRLCRCAGAEEIMVSEFTAGHFGGSVAMEPLPAVNFKNVSEPMIPYRVIY